MDWRGLLFAAAVMVAAAVAMPAETVASGGDICSLANVCKCEGNVISCTCNKDVRKLTVGAGSIVDSMLQTITKFEVKDCQLLLLQENAFRASSKLATVHVTNVAEVTFKARVFEEMESFLVDNVPALQFEKGAFEGVKRLNHIVIRKSRIPTLFEGALSNITNLQEFKLNEVAIEKMEKNAISIDLKPTASVAAILRCKIGNIEERGLEIGNGATLNMTLNEIEKAQANSIRISALNNVIMAGNLFKSSVDVEAAKILYKLTIHFTNNTMLNVDILKAVNIKRTPEDSAAYTLEELVTLHGGNRVNCKCLVNKSNNTGVLEQNLCVNGCTEATVATFQQSCQKNSAIPNEERLKDICKNSVDNKTENPPTRGHSTVTHPPGNHTSTVKPGNGAEKLSVYALPLITMYLFHMIL